MVLAVTAFANVRLVGAERIVVSYLLGGQTPVHKHFKERTMQTMLSLMFQIVRALQRPPAAQSSVGNLRPVEKKFFISLAI